MPCISKMTSTRRHESPLPAIHATSRQLPSLHDKTDGTRYYYTIDARPRLIEGARLQTVDYFS
jgi:hypothetical protein